MASAQNRDGGFPYRLGVESDTDTTGMALLALSTTAVRVQSQTAPADRFEVHDQRDDLQDVASIRPGDASFQRDAVSIHQQMLFCAGFPAVRRVRAGVVPVSDRPRPSMQGLGQSRLRARS